MKVSLKHTLTPKTLGDLPVNHVATDVEGDTVLRTEGGIVVLSGITDAGYYTKSALSVRIAEYHGELTIEP